MVYFRYLPRSVKLDLVFFIFIRGGLQAVVADLVRTYPTRLAID